MWDKAKCSICDFRHALGASNGPRQEIFLTYFDFLVAKEHAFIGNIFDRECQELRDDMKTLKNYHKSFKLSLKISVLLNTRYSSESDIEDITDDCLYQFVDKYGFESFE